MPRPSPHNAIIICMDVGKSVAFKNGMDNETFFEQSKECISWIIQRKLISQSPDVLSLILIGSNKSNDTLASSGYKKICCRFEFEKASWEMLKFIESEVETTDNDSDWIGALIVSIEMLKVYEEFNLVESKKIVFFSDFSWCICDKLDEIVKNLRESNITISIIGPKNILNLVENDHNNEPLYKKQKSYNTKSKARQKGEKLVAELWKKVPDLVTICTFKEALKQLCSYTRKQIRKTPWHCILNIGDVKISIAMLKKTDPKVFHKFETKYVKPGKDKTNTQILPSQIPAEVTVPVVRDKVMFYRRETNENPEGEEIEVGEGDTVEGFRYGNTIIPFTEADKAVMAFKPGPKSFSVIGFTSFSSVPFYLLTGECSYIVVPRDKDENAEIALSAIIQAMKRMECLAIVRKVYSDDRGLSLGILYPFIEEIAGDEESSETVYKECLIFIELAFNEEVKSVNFPSLENFAKNLSKVQYDAVDKLIDGMNLMDAEKGSSGEPCEAFEPSCLHDYKEQFYHYCVIRRGLYPDEPLPKNLPPYIENYFRIPESIEEKSKTIIEEIKKEFNIKEIRPRQKEITGNNWSQKEIGEDDYMSIRHFEQSLIDEEKNEHKKRWMMLFAIGFPTEKEMENYFDEILKDQNNEKTSREIIKSFEDVFRCVRNVHLSRDPNIFNWWMYKFKSLTREKENLRDELWNVIFENNLGLISVRENKLSFVTETEEENYLHMAETASLRASTPSNIEDIDLDLNLPSSEDSI